MSNTKTQASQPRANLLVMPQATKRHQLNNSVTGFTLSDVEAGESAFLPRNEGWTWQQAQKVAEILNRAI
jgi:hypothetical protein